MWIVRGVLTMSLFLGMLALGSFSQDASLPRAAVIAPVDAVATRETEQAARTWLALVDQGSWDDSWKASGLQFRKANTSKT
jgi:hypothetical protein